MRLNTFNFYEIRPLTISDYDQAIQLWQTQATLESHNDIASYTKEHFAAVLQISPRFSLAVIKDNELIGTILCHHDGSRGYIHQLVIDLQYRNTSIAQTLHNLCLGKLAHAGILREHIDLAIADYNYATPQAIAAH